MRNISISFGIISSVILSVAGYCIFPDFFLWFLPSVEGVGYISTSMTGDFQDPIRFAIALGLIPIIIVVVWKWANIISVKKRIASAAIIISGGILGVVIHYAMILSLAKSISKRRKNNIADHLISIDDYVPGIRLSQINIEFYLLAGVLISTVVVYFLFRQRKRMLPLLDFES